MENRFYCINVSCLRYFKTTPTASFLLQIYMSQENINILKYLKFSYLRQVYGTLKKVHRTMIPATIMNLNRS